MKRITVLLKTSEVPEVRRSIFAAGDNHIAAVTVSAHLAAVELADWYCGTPGAGPDGYIRLDALVDDERWDAVVSSIIATARAGMIEKVTSLPARADRVAAMLVGERAA